MISKTTSTLLGVLQGFSEFLPISSSGHLALVRWWLQLPAIDLFFISVLHLGTLAAIISVYQKELKGILWPRGLNNVFYRRIGLVIAALLPTISGIFIKPLIEQSLNQPLWIGCAFTLTGLYLFFTKKKSATLTLHNKDHWQQHISYPKAILIGAAQVLALFPGISRSGWTIATALFLNVPPRDAVFFSFLLAIPTIIGAAIWESSSQTLPSLPEISLLFIAFISSYLTGYIALKWLIRSLQTHKFYCFAFYLCPLGLFVILNELL